MKKLNISQTKKDVLLIIIVLLVTGVLLYALSLGMRALDTKIDSYFTNDAVTAYKPIHDKLITQGATLLCESGDAGKTGLNSEPWHTEYYKFDGDVPTVLQKVNAAVRDQGFEFNQARLQVKSEFRSGSLTHPKSTYKDSPGTVDLYLDVSSTVGKDFYACNSKVDDEGNDMVLTVKEGEVYIGLELGLPSRR